MLIDCDACAVRGPACGDCVVSVLLAGPAVHAHDGEPPGAEEGQTAAELDAAERAAIAVLAGCGLVPPLRLVPSEAPNAGGRRPSAPVSEGEREVS
jgi:predicted small lipoprotein YifL